MAMKYPNVTTVQIIFNMFRQKPLEEFFSLAEQKEVGVIVRVPLASGLLSGKMSSSSSFDKNDHRFFNRNGEAFDKGETFAGVDFRKGLEAVEELKGVFEDNEPLALWALRWILMFDQVGTVIPGASNGDQVISNVRAGSLQEISREKMEKVKEIYEKKIKPDVHPMW